MELVHETKFVCKDEVDLMHIFQNHIKLGIKVLKEQNIVSGKLLHPLDIICSPSAFGWVSANIPVPDDYKIELKSFDEMIRNLPDEDENGFWDFGKKGPNSEFNMKVAPYEYGYVVALVTNEIWLNNPLPKKCVKIEGLIRKSAADIIEGDNDEDE